MSATDGIVRKEGGRMKEREGKREGGRVKEREGGREGGKEGGQVEGRENNLKQLPDTCTESKQNHTLHVLGHALYVPQ